MRLPVLDIMAYELHVLYCRYSRVECAVYSRAGWNQNTSVASQKEKLIEQVRYELAKIGNRFPHLLIYGHQAIRLI